METVHGRILITNTYITYKIITNFAKVETLRCVIHFTYPETVIVWILVNIN
jgi:hypothetical protein